MHATRGGRRFVIGFYALPASYDDTGCSFRTLAITCGKIWPDLTVMGELLKGGVASEGVDLWLCDRVGGRPWNYPSVLPASASCQA